MLAVWRDEQQVERARANAQARQQCRRGGASVLTIGNVQPDPVLPRGATQQVGDGTVHAPFDRRRRPATSPAIWEQGELVDGSHGEKTRGHLPSSGGAPRTNWIQKYNCFAIETTGRADEHHRYPREPAPGSRRVPEPVRDDRGRWLKGTPATNPGGFSKAQRAALLDVREAAKEYTPSALKTLANIMNNDKAPPSARVQAASVLLDRGWGKPTQPVSSDPDGPLIVEIIQRVREPK